MKRVVIADIRSMNTEGKAIGHYFTVAQNYMDIFHDYNETYVAGGPVYEQIFKKNLIKLHYDVIEGQSKLKEKLHEIVNMQQLFEECQDDIIVLQSSAVATAYLGIILFKKKQTRLYMIQYNTMGLNSKMKRNLYKLAKRKINGVICPQLEIGEAYEKPYCVIPDYIYIDNKKVIDIPYEEKKYDFGMFGIITKDKGIIEAAERLKNTKYKVLIAGRAQTDEIRKRLEKISLASSNIEIKLDYLSEEEYRYSIAESRYCILNYSEAYSEHSSGVIYDIMFQGTPVVGTNCKTLNFIKKYCLGQIYSNISDFDPEIVLHKEKYEYFRNNIQRYFEVHKKYKNKLVEFINNQI